MRSKTLKPETRSSGRPVPRRARSRGRQIFFLSPANVSSVRGGMVLGNSGSCALASRLRGAGVPLGEIFTFISGLYFRGKLTYAKAYANPPAGLPGVVVITTSGGLVSPDRVLGLEEFRETVSGRVDATNSRYRLLLERDARLIRDHIGTNCRIILLGSIATAKYVEPLLGVFGRKLMVPAEFIGQGDMFRGGLLLRCVRERTELTYVSADSMDGQGGGRSPRKSISRAKAVRPSDSVVGR